MVLKGKLIIWNVYLVLSTIENNSPEKTLVSENLMQ
jgi:hypothetical protein